MGWILATVLSVFFLLRFLSGRRGIPILPSQPISTFHSMRFKRMKRQTRAALEAASALLE